MLIHWLPADSPLQWALAVEDEEPAQGRPTTDRLRQRQAEIEAERSVIATEGGVTDG